MAQEEKIFECEQCGGSYEKVQEGLYKCNHCGYKKEILTSTSSEILSLLNEANRLRREGRFDDADEVYQDICKKDSKNPEGYWGAFLSEYGIYHEEDPKTKRHIPTCHRISTVGVFNNENLQKVFELSNDNQKALYKESAEEIEEIRAKIVKIAQNEPPYDIFICYKRTIKSGEDDEVFTKDSKTAQEIYDKLTTMGYKVFFAEKTLQNLAGSEYEPIIFNALNTSKIMFVICSKPEYINAVWVKNEWRRYLKLMEYDESKHIIPVLQDMPGSKLPDLLKKHQALEINVGFETALKNTVARILGGANKANVQRVAIGQKKVAKKSSVIKNNVETREIKLKSATKLVVSDQTQVRNAFLSLKKRIYNMAIDDFMMLRNKESLKTIADFALTFIRFQFLNRNISQKLVGDSIENLDNKALMKYLEKTNNFGSPSACLPKSEGDELIAKFNDLVENCDKETLDAVFDEMYSEFEATINITTKSYLYLALAGWESDAKNKAFQVADNIVRTYPTSYYRPIYDAIIKSYDSSDVDGYIKLLKEYASCFMSNYCFPMAIDAYNKILEVDEGDSDTRYNKFLAEIKVAKQYDLLWNIYKFDDNLLNKFKDEVLVYFDENNRVQTLNYLIDRIRFGIAYVDEKTRLLNKEFLTYALNISNVDKDMKKMCQKAIDNVQKDGQIYPTFSADDYKAQNYQYKNFVKSIGGMKNVNDIKRNILFLQTASIGAENGTEPQVFDSWPLEKLLKLFDTLLTYYPQDKDVAIMSNIKQMAYSLKKCKHFDIAIKYYQMYLSSDKNASDCYWSILQCKLKCTDEDQLKYTRTPLKNFQEFQDALNSAQDERTVGKYQQIYNDQRTCKKKVDNVSKMGTKNKQPRDSKLDKFVKTKRLRKVCFVACAIVVALTAIGVALGKFISYKYETDPHFMTTYISTVDDLLAMKKSGKYTLKNDIDLLNVDQSKLLSNSDGEFTGKVYGEGHTISNLTIEIEESTEYGASLFGKCKGASFYNLTLESVNITQTTNEMQKYVGGLVSYGENVTIENVTISGGTINGEGFSAVGSVAGYLIGNSVVRNCTSTCPVLGNMIVGGIVGYLNGTAENLTNEKEVSGASEFGTSKTSDIGGVCGVLYGEGSNLTNKGAVTYTGTKKYVGGIVGLCGANLKVINNQGNVSGYAGVGGCVGCLWNGTFIPVDGIGEDLSSIASLDGATNTGNVTAKGYTEGDDSGKDINCGGIVGYAYKLTTFKNATNRGTIDVTAAGDINSEKNRYVGGIVGDIWSINNMDYMDLNNYGAIELNENITYTQIGGIVGHMFQGNSGTATFNNCSNKTLVGNAKAGTDVGGIVGYFQSGEYSSNSDRYFNGSWYYGSVSFVNCTQEGNVVAIKYVGGLAGYVAAKRCSYSEGNNTFSGCVVKKGETKALGTQLIGARSE